MLYTVSCGHLENDVLEQVQAIIDNSHMIDDWIRYQDSNWIIEANDSFDANTLRDSITSHENVLLLMNPLYKSYSGLLNTSVWNFIKKYNAQTAPKKRTSLFDSDKNSNIIDPQDFVIKDAEKLAHLKLDKATNDFVGTYFNRITFDMAAQKQKINLPAMYKNLLLIGKPGVGKSTLAKAMARQLSKTLNASRKMRTYFLKPSQLIGSYRGHTQINMQTLLDHAEGGVVIFDEIDTFMTLPDSDRQILSTINTHIGDKKNNPIIFGTLYGSNEQNFYNFNEGLKSRFNYNVRISGQSDEKLTQIFAHKVHAANLSMDSNVLSAVTQKLRTLRNIQKDNFGHIRTVENVLNGALDNMARRHKNNALSFDFTLKAQDIDGYIGPRIDKPVEFGRIISLPNLEIK